MIEHDSHVIEDKRIWRKISASDIFEKAGGIVLERTERRLSIVRISFKTAKSLCEEHGLNYLGPIFSHDVYYSMFQRAKDVTPKSPQ